MLARIWSRALARGMPWLVWRLVVGRGVVAHRRDRCEPDRLGVECAAGACAADPPAAPLTRVAGDTGGTLGRDSLGNWVRIAAARSAANWSSAVERRRSGRANRRRSRNSASGRHSGLGPLDGASCSARMPCRWYRLRDRLHSRRPPTAGWPSSPGGSAQGRRPAGTRGGRGRHSPGSAGPRPSSGEICPHRTPPQPAHLHGLARGDHEQVRWTALPFGKPLALTFGQLRRDPVRAVGPLDAGIIVGESAAQRPRGRRPAPAATRRREWVRASPGRVARRPGGRSAARPAPAR